MDTRWPPLGLRSPSEHGLGEHHAPKAFRIGVFRMADPTLRRGGDLGPFQTARPLGRLPFPVEPGGTPSGDSRNSSG